ncbi:MAG TPA: M3 family oligoendopeptidase, partial [Chryseosolibacter sp.]
MIDTVEPLKRPSRKFLPEDFVLTTWDKLKPYFDDLLNRPLNSMQELKSWFSDRSELESIISEDLAWRYIRMTCYTENQEYLKSYQDFIQNIQPEVAPVSDRLNRKAAASEFLDTLAQDEGYDILVRNLRKEIEIFREENVPLFTEITTETQKYAQITGSMTVEVDGKTLTL